MSDTVTVVLVGFAMALGLVGTVVPLIPGLALIWLAGLCYGLVSGFGVVGAVVLAVMSAVGVAGALAGILVPHRRAAVSGAAASSVWLGALMGVVGFFVIPVIGFPLGGVVGLYLGEHARTRDRSVAWRRTRATIAGFGVAALVQLGAGVVMVTCWLIWLVAG